ncbi:hypothetical protein [Pseudomonas fluorescens]|uniref:Uncharacterized protein n=1 Tax=Pseudomonas fluorescens TaxID=294 RepID=A0A5E6WM79_PSEFL|nr:hypothetical protein [Pseudomonas fluorescens]VVN29750.1 hypothetical protein PS659_04812 [Pseudomonas fluorescens]
MSIELKAGATGPVLICHGAEHVLNIAAAEDNPWIDQGISLNPEPGDSLSIVAEPALGEYQKFLADGGQWKLKCPADGTDVDFNLQLQSEFSAQPYKVPFRLGDFRREILDERPPISAPVVGDKVVAAVQVGSFYTKKELENVEVEWLYDWKPVDRVPTGHSGWSSFVHQVLTAGEHQIMASVHSPYDDRPRKYIFPINVYLGSPWEQASLFINGERVAWNSPSVVLFRGQPNEVRIEAPFLQEKDISLGLMNPDGLSIEAAPAFEAWVPVPDGRTTWVVTPAGNKSGRITLKLSSKETAQAWEIPCAVLSLNLADEADVLVDGVEVPPTGNWFIRDKAQTVTLTVKSGSPLAGLPVTLSCVIKSGLNVSDVKSVPDFDSEQTTYSWAVTGNTGSGTFLLSLSGKGMTTPITLLDNTLLSNNLSDEATFSLDGATIPVGGAIFLGGDTKELNLAYKNGGFLVHAPLRLSMEPKSGLSPNDISSKPPLMQVVTAHNWMVTAAEAKWGTFDLVASFDDERAEIRTPTLQLMGDIRTELELWFKGRLVQSNDLLFPIRGDVSSLMLKLKPGSLIKTLQVKPEWGYHPPFGVELVPNVGVVRTVDSITGASWNLHCGNFPSVQGSFSIRFNFIDPMLPGFELSFILDPVS